MMKHLLFLIIFGLLPGCNQDRQSTVEYNKQITMIKTPYRASPEKIKHIKETILHISQGDSIETVLQLLGQADENGPLYHRDDKVSLFWKKPKPIGEQWTYLLARDKNEGSVLDKNESLVRILLNNNGTVTRVDSWGRDFIK